MNNTNKESLIKDALFLVFQIDNVSNKFHNKISFMNLSHVLTRISSWEEGQIIRAISALNSIYQEIEGVSVIVDELNDPVLSLLESYDTNQLSQAEDSQQL